jgi:hypothetical protein
MSDLVRKVYEYRDLLGRRDLLRMPLDDHEADRLETLTRLFEWRPEDLSSALLPKSVRRRFARLDVRIPATVKIGDDVWLVRIVNLGAGGAVVEDAPPLRRGDLAVLRVPMRKSGREYHFSSQVVWHAEPPGRSLTGLTFVGVPIEARL